MADKIFHQLKGSRTRKVVKLFGKITTTTAGAIDSAGSTDCVGFSVSRTSAGLYRLTLEDAYASFVFAQATPLKAAGAWVAGKGVVSRVAAFSLANKTIDIEMIDDTGVADDVTDGSDIYFEITMADSTLTR